MRWTAPPRTRGPYPSVYTIHGADDRPGARGSEETAEILSDRDALAAIEAGLAEIGRDETVPLEVLREELAERRSNR